MGYNVLIVDDAGFVREILTNMVTQAGHRVVGEATTGTEAVKKAFNLKPDVVFMDLVLPEKNGVEAAIEIFEGIPGCKMIAVSTIEEDFVKRKAMQSGFIAYLKKPFSKSDVFQIFEQIKQHRTEARYG